MAKALYAFTALVVIGLCLQTVYRTLNHEETWITSLIDRYTETPDDDESRPSWLQTLGHHHMNREPPTPADFEGRPTDSDFPVPDDFVRECDGVCQLTSHKCAAQCADLKDISPKPDVHDACMAGCERAKKSACAAGCKGQRCDIPDGQHLVRMPCPHVCSSFNNQFPSPLLRDTCRDSCRKSAVTCCLSGLKDRVKYIEEAVESATEL